MDPLVLLCESSIIRSMRNVKYFLSVRILTNFHDIDMIKQRVWLNFGKIPDFSEFPIFPLRCQFGKDLHTKSLSGNLVVAMKEYNDKCLSNILEQNGVFIDFYFGDIKETYRSTQSVI